MKVQLPAMRAKLGSREYYATTMALSEIPHFFKFNDWAQFDPSQRAQRVLNDSRIPEIKNYILDNEDDYIFSSITASYDCPMRFISSDLDPNLGLLEMDLEDMQFVINDGQHRAAAIAAALKENPVLGKERISVLLFRQENLDRLQQMFTDLNRYAHKTSKSLDVLYDHRDHLSALTMEVAENVPAFRGQIDKERISLPAHSPKLLTLSALYDANAELLGKMSDRPKSAGYVEKVRQATQYWITVADAIPDWQRVSRGMLSAPELRKEKINTHSVVLRALGGIGNVLLTAHPQEWSAHVQRLADVDWRKAVGASVNPLWDNVCIVAGSVVSNRQARRAVLAVLQRELGLPLSSQDANLLHSLEREAEADHLPRGRRTPVGDYYQSILQALNESGGSARVNDVLERVEQLMKGVLREIDYEPLPSNTEMLRWRNTAQWARDAMVKEGLLKSNSPRGIWEITEAGRMPLTTGAS